MVYAGSCRGSRISAACCSRARSRTWRRCSRSTRAIPSRWRRWPRSCSRGRRWWLRSGASGTVCASAREGAARRCSLAQRVPEMANEQAGFWSNVADRYDRVVDSQIGGATRRMVRERVTREEHLGRVVEFGCVTGFFTGVLAAKADTLLATDISPGMLEVARQRVNAPNVTFRAEDCQRTSLPDGTFDTAFVALVIHFTVPGQTVAEMHRILRPGGTLVVVNLDLRALKGLARTRS